MTRLREILASRSFTEADQRWFADISGDVNPMHMDAAGAAATQAGERVVHGVHAALWALEQLACRGNGLGACTQIKVRFSKFLTLGTTATLVLIEETAKGLRAEIDAGGAQGAVSLRLGAARRAEPETEPPDGARPDLSAGPIVRDADAIAGASGLLDIPEGAERRIAEAFPALSALWSARAVAHMALMSTVVGMVAPGLHSIFSDFTLTLREPAGAGDPGFRFAVTGFDPRFRLANLRIGCAEFVAAVSAYLRYPPIRPPTFAEVAAAVPPGCFAGARALVVGGSRGIGAVVSQAVAAGGGRVVCAYAQNRAAAEALQAEARRHLAPEAFEILHFDARSPVSPAAPGSFTHLYYFATPRIFDQSAEVFSPGRFEAFCEIYVHGFHRTVMSLMSERAAPLKAFYPSSIAVAERPRNMTEYAMAKSAGEILCADLARAHPLLDIAVHRLPRIMTDQTATVPPVAAPSALAAIVPLLAGGDRNELQK